MEIIRYLYNLSGKFLKNSSGKLLYKKYTLPSEYQAVEWIASSGTQYIQLPFGFDNTDEVEFKFSITAGEPGDSYMVAPNSWNTSNNRYGMGWYTNKFTCCYGATGTGSTYLEPASAAVQDSNPHTWFYKNKIYSIPELSISRDCTSITWGSTTTNIRLFWGYASCTKGTIYKYIHKKANGTLYYLIPCYRVSDNVIGLYDVCSQTFYINNGSGTFTKGPNVN